MIRRMPTHCGDETCSSCVVAGDYIFLHIMQEVMIEMI